jgi:DNA-binding PadR family transcriptional regulator
MLDMAILGLLKEQPMHGYDLRKRLRSDFGLLASLSFGSLYPALGRLEAAGAVRALPEGAPTTTAPGRTAGRLVEQGGQGPGTSRLFRSTSGEVIPLSGSLTGEKAAFRARLAGRAASARPRAAAGSTRARKVYELTPRGDEMFERFLSEEPTRPEDAKAFALRWAFAARLTPSARLRLLERRRRQLEESLRATRRTADCPPRPLDRFERSLLEHSNDAIQLDLDWIDLLIASERAATGAGETEVS